MRSESASDGRQTPALHSNQRSAASGTAVHERFVGGVPELASRAYIEMIDRVVWATLLEAERFRELARRLDLQG